jgi:hypothetical protein
MKFINLIRSDGGVYGGFDTCDYSDLGCSATNPIALFLWFVGFLIVSGIIYLIKEKFDEASYPKRTRTEILEQESRDAWNRLDADIEERIKHHKRYGEKIPTELQNLRRRVEKAKKKKNYK